MWIFLSIFIILAVAIGVLLLLTNLQHFEEEDDITSVSGKISGIDGATVVNLSIANETKK